MEEYKLIRLNFLQYNPSDIDLNQNLSLDSLIHNEEFDTFCKRFLSYFSFKKLKTFSFSKEGFLALLLSLKDKRIAISKGESEALIEVSKLYLELGFTFKYLDLNIDGSVKLDALENEEFDYIFIKWRRL